MATTFDAHMQEIVREFLHTALIVDDRALPSVAAAPLEDEDGPAAPAGRGVGELVPPDSEGPEHDLDLRRLTDAFASRGVICAAIAPEPGATPDQISARLVPAAARADVVILDWVLNGDNGERTKALLERLLEKDRDSTGSRLRTIAIYTGQPALDGIADEVAEILEASHSEEEIMRVAGALDMTNGPVRISVFAKEHVQGAPPDRRVSPDDLPDRMIAEFAQLARGLVSGVALAALSALRTDTHRILRFLGPRLDPAYLGHRALQISPVEAEDHLVEMVTAEVASVIADHDVGSRADLTHCMEWVASRRDDPDFAPGALLDVAPLDDAKIDGLLRNGASGRVERIGKKTLEKKATQLFSASVPDAFDSDGKFFTRMIMRTRYTRPPRTLAVGTVLEREGEWIICIQPLCDSVRLREETSFPFLPLTVVAADGGANFVVRRQDTWIRLSLELNPRRLRLATSP